LTLSAEEKKIETALKHYPLQTNTNLLGVVLVRPIEPFPVILAELSNEIKSFTLKKNLFSRRGKVFYICFKKLSKNKNRNKSRKVFPQKGHYPLSIYKARFF
jgi:hypothetical protein